MLNLYALTSPALVPSLNKMLFAVVAPTLPLLYGADATAKLILVHFDASLLNIQSTFVGVAGGSTGIVPVNSPVVGFVILPSVVGF